jgi:LacI family kdg operon repressor
MSKTPVSPVGPIAEAPSRAPVDADVPAQTAAVPERGQRGARGATITIASVARSAGVSKTSVSRYLSGDLTVLSDHKREQIKAAIDRLGYRPNRLARGLKRGQTRLVGFVVADIVNPYSVAVIQGAEAAARARGYTMLLSNTGGSLEVEEQVLSVLVSYSVEGIILNATTPTFARLANLIPETTPLVLADRRPEGTSGFDFVGLANRAATRQAVQHLLDNGYRDLALFSQPPAGVSTRRERGAAFLEAVGEVPGVSGRVFALDISDETTVDRALADFFADGGRGRRAILATSGMVTLQTIRALDRAGLRMPDDVGLVGFDELDWSRLVGPGITTLRQPIAAIGAALAERLFARIGGERGPAEDVVFPGELIVRGSSAPV